jgi:hypothetical protein
MSGFVPKLTLTGDIVCIVDFSIQLCNATLAWCSSDLGCWLRPISDGLMVDRHPNRLC